MNSRSKTSVSLLLLLKNEEHQEMAWCLFVERYGTRIYQWCLNRNLQPSDAEDVSQNVLVKLAKHLRAFEYDPTCSFRGWLNRVTQNALIDYVNERRRQPNPIGGQDGCAHLETATAREDLVTQLHEAYDLEVLDEAVRRVRERVSPRRFEAWELAAKDRLSGAEIGRRLNMPVASVYTSKNQIQKLIQEEIKVMESFAR